MVARSRNISDDCHEKNGVACHGDHKTALLMRLHNGIGANMSSDSNPPQSSNPWLSGGKAPIASPLHTTVSLAASTYEKTAYPHGPRR
jgi:hypothetical protein